MKHRLTQRLLSSPLALALVLSAAAVPGGLLAQQTFTVTTAAATGAGSLAEAVALAEADAAADQIVFSSALAGQPSRPIAGRLRE